MKFSTIGLIGVSSAITLSKPLIHPQTGLAITTTGQHWYGQPPLAMAQDGDEDGLVGTGAITSANVDTDGLVISDANGAINSPADAYGPLNDLNNNTILDSQEAGEAASITLPSKYIS